jgi:FAD/FMN-containing dehydrogenase
MLAATRINAERTDMTLTSSQPTLDTNFAGELIRPGDPGYDEARKLFNGMIDKRPALIARCTRARDVQTALAHAREHDLEVAVRGGGHSAAGYSSCDDGIVIDVGPMKKFEIDVENRTGRFGAGLTWGELDAATQEHGLAVPGGRVTHTGIAGLTLGSGSSWLERKYGMTSASLVSAQVVTADGRVVRASAEENPELLWGLKGGGGNFGVVTEFEFRLHPVGPIVFAGMILHPHSATRDLARFYRDFMEQAPDEVGGGLALITAPPEDFVPEDARGKPACGLIVLYVGDPATGEEVLRPLLEWGDPLVKLVQPMPFVAVQQLTDPAHPWGIRDYSKIDYLPELPDEAIDAMADKTGAPSSPFTGVYLCRLGGAVARMDGSAMALNMPEAKWAYFCMAHWWDPSGQEEHIAWARDVVDTMRPWAADTAPPNFIAADEGTERLRRFYGDEKFERLVALKDEYDPLNVFALNQNIQPSGRSSWSAGQHSAPKLTAPEPLV